jgi:hypothetical protein
LNSSSVEKRQRAARPTGGEPFEVQMPTYRLPFHTGPTIVRQIAQKMREAGISVAIEGTERVYVDCEGEDRWSANQAVLRALREKHGTVFGLR